MTFVGTKSEWSDHVDIYLPLYLILSLDLYNFSVLSKCNNNISNINKLQELIQEIHNNIVYMYQNKEGYYYDLEKILKKIIINFKKKNNVKNNNVKKGFFGFWS